MKTISAVFVTVIGLWCGAMPTSFAQDLPTTPPPLVLQQTTTPPPPEIQAKSYALMDADTGKILAASNPELQLAPASTTKIMTMYIVSNALAHKQLKLTDLIPISEKAWRMEGSRMFVQVGNRVPAKDLIQGIVVASGNDSTVAMAEYLAGTEEAFADLMNQQARLLGMKNSHFMDSTGMPSPNHYSSAKDLALLGRAVIKHFPHDYAIYSQKSFSYNNITQPNRNRLLWNDPSVDGLKTGYTDDAGYCLVASALRNGMRVISVVMGAPSNKVRMEETQRLLNYAFRFFETRVLYQAGSTIATEKLWFGKKDTVTIGARQNIVLTLPRGQFDSLKVNTTLEENLEAPIKKNQKLGTMELVRGKTVLLSVPLVALEDVEEANFLSRWFDHIKRWFSKLFG